MVTEDVPPARMASMAAIRAATEVVMLRTVRALV
jgi:hypothetical protein